MKKVFMMTIAALTLALAACGNKSEKSENTQTSETGEKQEAVVPNGFKTHEFANFSISLPEEFTTSDDASSDNATFSSEAMHKLDNSEEVSSSANINCGFMTGGATPSQIDETASTMKLSQEAAGETCDEPIIEGNVIKMRTYHEEDGYKVITWRWWIVSEDGKNVSGSIYYPDTQAKFYDDAVAPIINSIKIK